MKAFRTFAPLIAGLLATSAFAANSTTSFQVTAQVAPSCTVSANTLAFGNYTLAQLDGTTNITLTCTNGTNAVVTLDVGTGVGATVTNRKMTSASGATNTLAYNLYSDNGRTLVFGVTSVTGVAVTGTGSAQTVPVYGRIPANQTSRVANDYSDTITVTVTY